MTTEGIAMGSSEATAYRVYHENPLSRHQNAAALEDKELLEYLKDIETMMADVKQQLNLYAGNEKVSKNLRQELRLFLNTHIDSIQGCVQQSSNFLSLQAAFSEPLQSLQQFFEEFTKHFENMENQTSKSEFAESFKQLGHHLEVLKYSVENRINEEERILSNQTTPGTQKTKVEKLESKVAFMKKENKIILEEGEKLAQLIKSFHMAINPDYVIPKIGEGIYISSGELEEFEDCLYRQKLQKSIAYEEVQTECVALEEKNKDLLKIQSDMIAIIVKNNHRKRRLTHLKQKQKASLSSLEMKHEVLQSFVNSIKQDNRETSDEALQLLFKETEQKLCELLEENSAGLQTLTEASSMKICGSLSQAFDFWRKTLAEIFTAYHQLQGSFNVLHTNLERTEFLREYLQFAANHILGMANREELEQCEIDSKMLKDGSFEDSLSLRMNEAALEDEAKWEKFEKSEKFSRMFSESEHCKFPPLRQSLKLLNALYQGKVEKLLNEIKRVTAHNKTLQAEIEQHKSSSDELTEDEEAEAAHTQDCSLQTHSYLPENLLKSLLHMKAPKQRLLINSKAFISACVGFCTTSRQISLTQPPSEGKIPSSSSELGCKPTSSLPATEEIKEDEKCVSLEGDSVCVDDKTSKHTNTVQKEDVYSNAKNTSNEDAVVCSPKAPSSSSKAARPVGVCAMLHLEGLCLLLRPTGLENASTGRDHWLFPRYKRQLKNIFAKDFISKLEKDAYCLEDASKLHAIERVAVCVGVSVISNRIFMWLFIAYVVFSAFACFSLFLR